MQDGAGESGLGEAEVRAHAAELLFIGALASASSQRESDVVAHL
jgi:hypothetical protein